MTRSHVDLSAVDDDLRVTVNGGDGGQLPLSHIRDRVEAAGGSMSVNTTDGLTTLEVWFPGPPQSVAAAQASRRRSGPKADLVT